MALGWRLTLSCVVLNVFWVSAAPGFVDRRSSRDLDKVYGLRARLEQLQKQIHELEAEEEAQKASGTDKEAEPDVSREPQDVIRAHGATESQMTSQRQKHAQMLAEQLDEGTQRDMHELGGILKQLLRETSPGAEEAGKPNSAGEYLGDKHNGHSEQLLKKYNDNSAEDQLEEESEEEEEEDEEEREELQTIYNRLMKLYGRQRDEKPHVESVASPVYNLPNRESPARFPDHVFPSEEGSFGDFVDADEESRPPAPLKNSVLSAIEKRLQEDIRDARKVGISIDDLIQDVREKAVSQARGQHLRQVERELSKLLDRRE